MRPVFFVHIPKTAGTSFRVALEKKSDTRLLCDYGPRQPKTDKELVTYANGYGSAEKLVAGFPEEELVVVAGHVSYRRYAHLVPQDRVMSLVRNPIERLVSEYQHVARMQPEHVSDFLEFIERPRNKNLQHRCLDGLEVERAHIGLSSHYSDYLYVLSESMQLPMPVLSMNKAPTDNKRMRDDIPIEWITAAYDANRKDLALLFSVGAVFEKRLNRLGVLTKPRSGRSFHLDASKARTLVGMLDAEGLDTGIVGIRVNDEPRAIVALRGGGAGRCAKERRYRFAYPLGLLGATPGDNVSVSLLGDEGTSASVKVPNRNRGFLSGLVRRLR